MELTDAQLIAAGETRAVCNLDTHPATKNWVEANGGLPEYIHSIACALVRGGHPISNAIQIAISRVKVWASGTGVNKDTQAKAAAALAEWEAMKASAKAKRRDTPMNPEFRSGQVRPEGDPDKRLFAARVLNYGPVDDHGTSWAPGVFSDSLRASKPPAVWCHDDRRPIGRVVEYRDSADGLDVIVQLADFDAVPDAKMAHALLREGVIDNFSFRFRRETDEPDENNRGATRITKARMEEVSPVLVASGQGTRTLAVRSSPETTTRAAAADLLGQVAAGEIDAATALEQLAGMRSAPDESAFREWADANGYEVRARTVAPDPDIAAELRSLDSLMEEF